MTKDMDVHIRHRAPLPSNAPRDVYERVIAAVTAHVVTR